MLVPRVLVVAGPKGKGGVDEIAIDGVNLQPPAAGVKGGLDPLRTMIGVPQLCGDKDVLPPNRPRLEKFLHRLANRFFIAVALRAIEMSESHFQGCLHRLFGLDRIRDERAKPDRRHGARSIVEWDLCVAKRIGGLHAHTLSSEAGRRTSDGGVRGSVRASDRAGCTGECSLIRLAHSILLSPAVALNRDAASQASSRIFGECSIVRGKYAQF